MRVAVCFYGLVGSAQKKFGKGASLDPKLAHKFYKKNVFKYIKNYDVFIHSQSIEYIEDLKNLYSPKLYCIERKKFFFFKIITNLKFIRILFFSIFKFSKLKQRFLRGLNGYSRWYSTKKVIELKKKYERENNFKYDLVFLTRLDLAFITSFYFNKIDGKFLTVPNHNDVPTPRNNYMQKVQLNNKTYEKGISDFWFISASDNIDKFASLVNRFKKYNISNHISSLQHSKYLKLKLQFYKYRGLDHEAIRRLKFSKE